MVPESQSSRGSGRKGEGLAEQVFLNKSGH